MSLEYSEWLGGKPRGYIAQCQRDGSFTVFFSPSLGAARIYFGCRAHGGDIAATKRAAVACLHRRCTEMNAFKNRWRYVHDVETDDRFIEVQLTQEKSMIVDIIDLAHVEAYTWCATNQKTDAAIPAIVDRTSRFSGNCGGL